MGMGGDAGRHSVEAVAPRCARVASSPDVADPPAVWKLLVRADRQRPLCGSYRSLQ
jgi:hypothetical protein